ncbi:MAG: cytochrome c [Alcanivoracaceae bacterium]|nr:cytochrome c [Alcanivoracaceae bacterium]
MKIIKTLFILGILGLIAGSAVIYSGIYPIGADVPHNKLTYWIFEQAREHSIERASAQIKVPDLSSADMLLSGGADYNDMCASCHLKPGQKDSDMSLGLYPKPPNLSLTHHGEAHEDDDKITEKKMFWTIKHGIKASGMPAWGITHDDDRIWAMVAFIKKMPDLTPNQYQVLTARE